LLPGWRDEHSGFVREVLNRKVVPHDTYFLTASRALHIPSPLVPGTSGKDSNCTVSIADLAAWLAEKASGLGAGVYCGFAAAAPLIENGCVKGVVLRARGLGHDGNKRENYLPEEIIRAKVTILADGVCGPVSTQVIQALRLDAGRNPQTYSIGLKQLLKLPSRDHKGQSRVIQTFGYPHRLNVFGGGFIYDMGASEMAVGLVVGLDWPYYDLNPQQELELFKAHPLIARTLADTEIVAAGAKMIPEGGLYSMPKLYGNGVMLAGDAAGMVNLVKLKGIHLAVRAGMSAGLTAVEALARGDISAGALAAYDDLLRQSGLYKELSDARNMRQCFMTPLGLLLGAPMTMVQRFIPLRLPIKGDRQSTKRRSIRRAYEAPFDRKTFAARSGAMHDENILSHIFIRDEKVCLDCIRNIGGPCTCFCPVEVYSFNDRRTGIAISSTDCIHCRSCAVKCPMDNIDWKTPEGGFGPRFRRM
ncbi:MAG TPA: electron-transfer flavoprotein:ubiquinone oxidoreductase, partial [Sedimentisphaerales bacterium]|nr:electron-transfer flavoprotein:ubiquinone oxidoreductase [Sedimentisphaerales bacterium]